MHGGSSTHAHARRRLQLILQQTDSLPTLSAIAVRLLKATASPDGDAREVIRLVASDPSLSAKVLQLCRRSHRGLSLKDATIDRAVLMLGFDEIRSAALAVEVFEMLDGLASRGGEARQGEHAEAFNRTLFWQHCLAVAIGSEAAARTTRYRRSVSAGEAFLAGLLHDLGHLALHAVLPQSFGRACAFSEAHGHDLDSVARQVIGVDPHAVGKHLAEHWGLPPSLVESIWLAGQPEHAIPENAHRDLVRIVTLADSIARRNLLAHPGHGLGQHDPTAMAAALDLPDDFIASLSRELHGEVSARSQALGLGEDDGEELLRQTLRRAMEALGTARARAERPPAAEHRQRADHAGVNQALKAFFGSLSNLNAGGSFVPTCRAIACSANAAFGASRAAVVRAASPWTSIEIVEFDEAGVAASTLVLDGPGAPIDSITARGESDWSDAVAMLPWAAREWIHAMGAAPKATLLDAGPEAVVAVVRASVAQSIAPEAWTILQQAWGWALASVAFAERAATYGEQMVDVNARLVEMQQELAERRAMASVGEIAAGAAHEMNNPLTVISGRSQILAARINDPALSVMAAEVSRQAHRLSDLITSLRLAATAPTATPQLVTLTDVVNDAQALAAERLGTPCLVRATIPSGLPLFDLDRAHLSQALAELIRNAHEAAPGIAIEVRVQIAPSDGRLMILVIDRGPGLSDKALTHAFDPFFSEKPAGRQPGLGLARARRLVEASGGEISLRNAPEGGAVATIAFSTGRATTEGRAHAA